jgi:hypothetical protein
MPFNSAPAIIAVGTSQTTNPMDQAMIKRASTDPKAVQMLWWAVQDLNL